MFRDWAEDLVISKSETLKTLPKTNTETIKDFKELLEIIDSAAVICGNHSKLSKRLGLNQAMFSHLIKRPWLVSEKMQQAIETGCRNKLKDILGKYEALCDL
jgi:hypothetical protein